MYNNLRKGKRMSNPREIPRGLQHTPIVCISNYDQIDGRYRGPNDDVKFLSIGLAQWDETSKTQPVSCKVLRHTGERWSPQSEEVPIHRCIDMCAFVAEAFSAIMSEDNNSVVKNLSGDKFEDEDGYIKIPKWTENEGYYINAIRKYLSSDKGYLLTKAEHLQKVLPKFIDLLKHEMTK